MKILKFEKTQNEVKIEIEGVGHTLLNFLQESILTDKDVIMGGYRTPHPLSNNAIIYLRTKDKVKPEKVLLKAIKKSHKITDEFKKKLLEVFGEN